MSFWVAGHALFLGLGAGKADLFSSFVECVFYLITIFLNEKKKIIITKGMKRIEKRLLKAPVDNNLDVTASFPSPHMVVGGGLVTGTRDMHSSPVHISYGGVGDKHRRVSERSRQSSVVPQKPHR